MKIAETNPKRLRSAFEYELTNITTTLFNSSGLSRQAEKASPSEGIWSLSKDLDMQLPQRVHFVIDGGSLLRRLAWQKSLTYEQLVQMYVDLVIATYGKATVVFDGYTNVPSTRSSPQKKRTQSRM